MKRLLNLKDNKKIKSLSLFEISLIIFSIIAFSCIVSWSIPEVKASQFLPTGCCLETDSGATCQDMLMADSNLCKEGLIGTSCEEVSECEKGCCFNSEEGLCSLNSPKSSCVEEGGEWFDSASCDIPYCQIGCCILGNSAKESTSKECRELSEKYKIEKDWRPLDEYGTCSAYSDLQKKGACILDSVEYYPEKECEFTTKESCSSLGGIFNSDYLCTAEELNTICEPSEKTTCVEGRDEVYFLDTCGNLGNIYDADKIENSLYWTKVLSPTSSEICSISEDERENCGNCDYLEGSFCQKYDSNLDNVKPTYGNNICRDLSCDTRWGLKQHGESWCVQDYDLELGIAKGPVGARSFVASCLDGEVSLEGCADFNQEVCFEQSDNNSGFTQGKCFVNDWRSCLKANDEDSYSEVEKECEKYVQCTMFNNAYGDNNLKRSDGKYLAGFNPDIPNSEQGAAGDVGKDSNSQITWCVPKYTPGFQFWNDALEEDENKGMGYGGSEAESGALCSIGSFTCVSKMKRECELGPDWTKYSGLCAGGVNLMADDPDCDPWQDEANWECNIDGVTRTIQTQDLPKWLGAINSRCQAIGTCGSKINIKNNFGYDEGFTIARGHIDAEGDNGNASTSGYNLSKDYLSSLSKIGLKTAGSMTSLTERVIKGITGKATTNDVANAQFQGQARQDIAETGDTSILDQGMEIGGGVVGLAGTIGLGKSALSGSGQTTTYMIGKLAPEIAYKYSSNYVFLGDHVVGITEISGSGEALGSRLAEEGFQAVGSSYASSVPTSLEAGGSYFIKDGFVFAEQGGQLLGTTTSQTGSQGSQILGSSVTNYNPIKSADIVSSGGKSTGGEGAGGGINFGQIGITIVVSIAASIAGYQIGKMIVKNQDWSPGRSKEFLEGISAAFGAYGAAAATIYFAGGIKAAASACMAGPVGCIIGIIIILAYSIYENCFDDKYDENQFYTLQFTCQQWEPPQNGECNSCNNDIRPCSEYRCKSLGSNCEYNTELGEPGICEDTSNPWRAEISPWEDALSEEHKYYDITDSSFKIKNSNSENGKIEPWENLEFGIETNKPAVCKIDTIRTEEYNEMRYTMSVNENFELGKPDLLKHKITLNAYVGNSSTSSLQLKQNSENTYYIRCKNAAGQVNENEFAVRISVDEGPDLTAPLIKEFSLEDGAYLSKGTNSTDLRLYVNEPSECRYSIEQDVSRYSDMKNNMSCITNPNMDVFGNWMCGTQLQNLSIGENKFYFKCKDQPNLDFRRESKRNENKKSTEFNLNVCSQGLEIVDIKPADSEDIIIGGNVVAVDLQVETSGCINGGEAVCEFSINNGSFIEFFETGNKLHKQKLTSIVSGKKDIEIKCIDEAGNTAQGNTSFEVQVDNSAPEIVRTYKQDENLMIVTNEESVCKYSTDDNLKCGFDFLENISETKSLNKLHSIPWNENKNYYIKCQDEYGNSEVDCSIEIKTY